jgi:hypothetical protein
MGVEPAIFDCPKMRNSSIVSEGDPFFLFPSPRDESFPETVIKKTMRTMNINPVEVCRTGLQSFLRPVHVKISVCAAGIPEFMSLIFLLKAHATLF